MEEQAAPAVRLADMDALYRAHARPLYAFIYRKVGNREAAEDITGDVFTKALAHLDPTRDERSMVAWLFRVARNAVADYWRAGRGASITPFEEAYQTWQSASPSVWTGRQQATARRAHIVLACLPDKDRAVLSYRLLEGLSVAETARRMGLSTANVKVLQHRALKHAASLDIQQIAGQARLAADEVNA